MSHFTIDVEMRLKYLSLQRTENMDKSTEQLKLMVYSSLMATLTAVGSYIVIPIGPVPIVLRKPVSR